MSFNPKGVFSRFACLLVLSAALAPTLMAQRVNADLTGRVLDQNGAAVTNATVTARNLGTSAQRTAQTNEDGEYVVREMPPGRYEITVEAANFSKALVRDLELNIGTTSTLNFDLKPGQLTETVEVAAGGVLVETTRSDLADVVTPLQVQTLPLLNRTFSNLSVITPEARPVGNFDPTKTRIGSVGFSGGDGRQVDVNVDGGDNKDNVVGSLIQNFAYESIQEFQVLQHRWTAEAGRAVGGVVNVVSKSGTNEFHGSAFANFRDEALRAREYFEKPPASATVLAKPPFSRQEVGGSISGPLKRDRAWFFGTYERFRERQNNAVRPAALPQLAAIPGVSATDIIPTPYDDHLATIKIDQKITDAQSIFYRFSSQKNSSPNDQIAVPATSDLTNGNTNSNTSYSFVGSHSWTLSPTKLNQFSFHYQDFNNAILGVTDQPNLVFPTVQSGRNVNVPQATLVNKYQFRDDFSWAAGDHALKFGTNYIHTRIDGFFFFGAQGYQVTFFDDPLTIRNNTNGLYPQGFATPGAVRQITFSDGQGDHRQTVHQLAFYVQDDWKVRSNLTFNLGLRWDANIGNLPTQNDNRTMRVLRQLNDPRARAIAGDPDKLLRTTPSFTEFQPRVGFAWDPTGSGKTVIRGGYGIFYDQLFQNLTLFSLTQSNPELYQTIVSLTNSAVGAGQLSTFRFGVDPLPPVPADFNIGELAFGGFGRINDPDATEPYVQKFSIGFETQLWRDTTLSSDFVHTLGVHEPRVQV
ncbi:MAG: TonB-dependent receptor domain-containing protein, partial [Pyrinomonadaceae bacterium]